MATSTTIANLALSHIGHGVTIDDLDTEQTREAIAVRTVFEQARDEVLRDFAWPFATKEVALALVETLTSDTAEWGYAYRYPADCFRLRRLKSGVRNDTRASRAKYKITRDDDGPLILTDAESVEAEYTVLVSEVDQWPVDFRTAVSRLIAYYVAPSITAGSKFFRPDVLWAEYQNALGRAMSNAANEEQRDEPPDSEFITARG